MITEIIEGRVHDVIAHEPTDAELAAVTAALAAQGVRVEPVQDIFRTLHLWAAEPVPTRAEVRAIAAFKAITDCRIDWHEAEVASC